MFTLKGLSLSISLSVAAVAAQSEPVVTQNLIGAGSVVAAFASPGSLVTSDQASAGRITRYSVQPDGWVSVVHDFPQHRDIRGFSTLIVDLTVTEPSAAGFRVTLVDGVSELDKRPEFYWYDFAADTLGHIGRHVVALPIEPAKRGYGLGAKFNDRSWNPARLEGVEINILGPEHGPATGGVIVHSLTLKSQ